MKFADLLILGAGILITSIALGASVYRWVDDTGMVHYADTPPEGVEAELVEVESKPTDRAQMARTREASKAREQADAIRQAERASIDAEEAAGEQESAKARADLCVKARERYQVYINNRRLYRVLENGEREWYSDEEIEAARESARKSVEEFCD